MLTPIHLTDLLPALERRLPLAGTLSWLLLLADAAWIVAGTSTIADAVAEVDIGSVSVGFMSQTGSTMYGCSLMEEFLLNIMFL